MSGCFRLYDDFEGGIENNTSEAHFYAVTVDAFAGGATKGHWQVTARVGPNQSYSLGAFGGFEGTYSIEAWVDNTTRAWGQSFFRHDEGPGGFIVQTSPDEVKIIYSFYH